MSSPAVTVHPDATLAEAARIMARKRVKRLPVVNDLGMLEGVVSRSDLLKVFLRPDEEIDEGIRTAAVAELSPGPGGILCAGWCRHPAGTSPEPFAGAASGSGHSRGRRRRGRAHGAWLTFPPGTTSHSSWSGSAMRAVATQQGYRLGEAPPAEWTLDLNRAGAVS